MRAGSRALALFLLASLLPAGRLLAAPARGRDVPERLRHLLLGTLLRDARVPPQAARPADSAGDTVDVSRLERPLELERTLRAALRRPIAATRLSVAGGTARLGHFAVGSDETIHGPVVVLEGNAEVHGRLEGNLVTLDGDISVFPGGTVAGDVLAIGGAVHRFGSGKVTGTVQALDAALPAATAPPAPVLAELLRHAAGLVGLFVTLTVLGFGLVTFGRPNLEIVSDTVTHSFGRSFLAGLLGQVLVLPTFGMLVVGLALTIAGALLIPFAIAVYVLLVLVASIGGLIAVAHAMGERITRRRLARGIVVSPNSYRYVATGLGAVATVWIGWVAFGAVPLAGTLMFIAAALTTWTVATVGFGAALLSRGGVREHFAGRLVAPEMMTDEYLWATPQFGVPAAKRPDPTRE